MIPDYEIWTDRHEPKINKDFLWEEIAPIIPNFKDKSLGWQVLQKLSEVVPRNQIPDDSLAEVVGSFFK